MPSATDDLAALYCDLLVRSLDSEHDRTLMRHLLNTGTVDILDGEDPVAITLHGALRGPTRTATAAHLRHLGLLTRVAQQDPDVLVVCPCGCRKRVHAFMQVVATWGSENA